MPAAPAGDLHATRPQDFHDLMRHRVMNILLVCSPYDLFSLEEAGQLGERVLGEFRELDLQYRPALTGATHAAQAEELVQENSFDLVITTPHIGDTNAIELVRRIRERAGPLPAVILGHHSGELERFSARHDLSELQGAFLWQGDVRILLAIVKLIEDQLNLAHDTRSMGVQVIVLVEDSLRFSSSFLPVIYTELFRQAQRVVGEGVNFAMKVTRMRARPKIVLCRTYEEAWKAFSQHRDDVLGVISDVEFPKDGEKDPQAGVKLAHALRSDLPDVPILLQSARPENHSLAESVGAAFLLKGPLLLQALRAFMLEDFGFGDFIFKLPDETELTRASNLRQLEDALRTVCGESIAHHASRNHFSRWLKARTDFDLARELRPRTLSSFPSTEAVRQDLVQAIARYREERSQELVADFDPESLDETVNFSRIGGGSLGGKARGLAFARLLMGRRRLRNAYPGVRVWVPPSVVIATDIFDRFLEENDLRERAIRCADDEELWRLFEPARFPERAERDLATHLETCRAPLAVRSSSLLEDSHDESLAGTYDTFLLPNVDGTPEARLAQLVRAVKRVYASTFSSRAKRRLENTPYRLEEEKMAVVVQRIVGTAHGDRFFPTLAGVARSYVSDAVPSMQARDGIVALKLGLGPVADDEDCLRFSQRRPEQLCELLEDRQNERSILGDVRALSLGDGPGAGGADRSPSRLGAREAVGLLETLRARCRDAAEKRAGAFPLYEIVGELLATGQEGMGGPVEIEFAVELSPPEGDPRLFGVLQIRPLPSRPS